MTERDARDDLAFMRNIVAAGEDTMRPMGAAYFAAGLCYGIQCLLHGLRMLGWEPGWDGVDLAIGIVPTFVFLAFMILLVARDRGQPRLESSTSRAIGHAFACVGLANLALVAVIGLIAWRQQSLQTWLIYPCVVMILQGTAWLFAFMLRRRTWLGAIAAGWFATGIGMAAALALESDSGFLIVLGFGLFAFMTAPGFYLMRPVRSA